MRRARSSRSEKPHGPPRRVAPSGFRSVRRPRPRSTRWYAFASRSNASQSRSPSPPTLFGGDHFVALGRESRGIDAEHDVAIAFEKAATAIQRKARMTGHANQAVQGRGRTADIEDGIQHAGHRPRRAGAHRHQKRPAAVAELSSRSPFRGIRFLPPESVGELLPRRRLPLTIAAHSSMGSTKAGGTGRPSAAMRARLAALAPTMSAGCCSTDPAPIRSICM